MRENGLPTKFVCNDGTFDWWMEKKNIKGCDGLEGRRTSNEVVDGRKEAKK